MAKAKLNLRKLKDDGTLKLAESVYEKLAADPEHAQAKAVLALGAAAADAKSVRTATSNAKADLQLLYLHKTDKFRVLRRALGRAAVYVESATGGDATGIVATGLSVSERPPRLGRLPAPAELRLAPGLFEGTLKCRWKPGRGRPIYLAEYATSAEGPWTQFYVGTAARCTTPKLNGGALYWFRVCAQGTSGPGAWSDMVIRRVG